MKKLIHTLINYPYVKRFLTDSRSITRLFFEFSYIKADPYNTEAATEKDKFKLAFQMLGTHRFERGIEIGCGEGKNIKYIAQLCNQLEAVDISMLALKRAIQNNSFTNVRFYQHDLIADNFKETFDYIFCSEVLYYFTISQLMTVLNKLINSLNRNGILHMVHCRCVNDDVSGVDLKQFGAKTIHQMALSYNNMRLISDHEEKMYRITIIKKI